MRVAPLFFNKFAFYKLINYIRAMKELRSKLNEAILAYCEAFAAKQGLTFETFNKHLGVANFGGNM